MSDKLILTFDKSNEDIPVLIIAKEGYGGFMSAPELHIKNIITGDRAVQIYNELLNKEENNDKEH